jgi:hypothetical protein
MQAPGLPPAKPGTGVMDLVMPAQLQALETALSPYVDALVCLFISNIKFSFSNLFEGSSVVFLALTYLDHQAGQRLDAVDGRNGEEDRVGVCDRR